ncbi:MAG: TetR/AcrR family transcriptional regulator [Myxococcota bacterium]
MAKQKDAAPGRRRQPRRRTGAAIVDAVVLAAEKILSEGGPDALTTSRLAKVSGVSVGSIYQYFESKKAVVGELARRIEKRSIAIMYARLEAVRDKGLPEIIEALVGALADRQLGDAEMRKIVQEEVPRSWVRKASDETNSEAQRVVAMIIGEHRDAVRKGDPELMAFILVRAVESAFEGAVSDRPELLTDPGFLGELRHLVTAYLVHEPHAAGDA